MGDAIDINLEIVRFSMESLLEISFKISVVILPNESYFPAYISMINFDSNISFLL